MSLGIILGAIAAPAGASARCEFKTAILLSGALHVREIPCRCLPAAGGNRRARLAAVIAHPSSDTVPAQCRERSPSAPKEAARAAGEVLTLEATGAAQGKTPSQRMRRAARGRAGRRPSELAPKRAAEEPRQPSARPNKSRRALISAAFAHLRRRGRQERKYILFHRLVLQTESRDCRCDERGPISEPNRAGLRGEARLAGRISNQA